MLTHVGMPANAAVVAPASGAGVSASKDASPVDFVGDDPVAIRDALVKRGIKIDSPSLSERLRSLVHAPYDKTQRKLDLAGTGLDRDLTFVLPVHYGIRYQAEKRLLTVNVDLSGDGTPGQILLKKTITGPRGRGLVVAGEAKSKGYIQRIDLIELDAGNTMKTTVHGRVRQMSRAALAKANDDFAIVLTGRLAPPYLSTRSAHTDPDNEEPTDITTTTSTLHFDIKSIWLVSPQRGVVLSKNLHLSK